MFSKVQNPSSTTQKCKDKEKPLSTTSIFWWMSRLGFMCFSQTITITGPKSFTSPALPCNLLSVAFGHIDFQCPISYIAAFNVQPDLCNVFLHSASENIMHKHIQCAAQQILINAKALAVHPVRVKTQNADAHNLQHETVLETMRQHITAVRGSLV